MPRQVRVEFPGAIYHITIRGNGRQSIFGDDRDRERFLRRLAESVEAYGIRLYLFALMSNHAHFLCETPSVNLSRFMQSLETGYTVYFNLRHRTSGHLFQGRYKAKLVEGDEYLLGTFSSSETRRCVVPARGSVRQQGQGAGSGVQASWHQAK